MISLTVLALLGSQQIASSPPAVETIRNFYAFKMLDIDGSLRPMGEFQGKVIMVVNVATYCGNTPQYAALQKLYDKYKSKGFVVLGFPVNDFGGQEPGTEKEIKEFCTSKYNVTFPMFSKVHAIGPQQAKMYQWLVNKTGGKAVEWNFTKFLISRHGQLAKRFSSRTKPDEPEVLSAIEFELAKRN